MKKKLFLCGVIASFPLLTACPDLGTLINEEEKVEEAEVKQDEVAETKTETKEEEKEQPKEENKEEEQPAPEQKPEEPKVEPKEEEKEEENEEPQVEPEKEPESAPEPIWEPDASQTIPPNPLAQGDVKQKPVLSKTVTLSSNEEYTEVSYNDFHEVSTYICDSHTYSLKTGEKKQIYSYATIRINGRVALEDGLTNIDLKASKCWYKIAGDTYGVVGSNFDPSFPDVASLTVLTGVKGNEERIRVWEEEVQRADKANNTLTANKFAYYLLNTRAKNIENKQDSVYLVTYVGDTSEKTFKYYLSEDGFKFTFTCSSGTTEYVFNEVGRVTRVACVATSSEYENFECTIKYRDESVDPEDIPVVG